MDLVEVNLAAIATPVRAARPGDPGLIGGVVWVLSSCGLFDVLWVLYVGWFFVCMMSRNDVRKDKIKKQFKLKIYIIFVVENC